MVVACTLGIIALYFLLGLGWAAIRAWKIGVHRVKHDGDRHGMCDHWACGFMADDGLTFTFSISFWPLAVPVHFIGRFLFHLIRAPYLRSLPPENEHKV